MTKVDAGFGLNKSTNETLQKGGSFFAKFLDGPLETLSETWNDSLKHKRLRRSATLEKETIAHLRSLGYDAPPLSVPMKVIVPLLEAATLEEDDNLQSLWAALLANASTPEFAGKIGVSFVSILKELGPMEVKILSVIYEAQTKTGETTFRAVGLPDIAYPYGSKGEVHMPDENGKWLYKPAKEVEIAIWNLIKLACVGGESLDLRASLLALTPLGEALIRACTIVPRSDTPRQESHGYHRH